MSSHTEGLHIHWALALSSWLHLDRAAEPQSAVRSVLPCHASCQQQRSSQQHEHTVQWQSLTVHEIMPQKPLQLQRYYSAAVSLHLTQSRLIYNELITATKQSSSPSRCHGTSDLATNKEHYRPKPNILKPFVNRPVPVNYFLTRLLLATVLNN